VERIGPVMFPGRWKLFFLSYWNRAKRKGKITILSAGSVAHQVPGGYMDPIAKLPDGRTHLQQTIQMILKILKGEALRADQSIPKQISHYALYREAAFNRPEYYPIQPINTENYQPIGKWMGRLILPQQEKRFQGVFFEVHHAPDSSLIGRTVKLRWSNRPDVQKRVKAVTKDVHFSADAEFSSKFGGAVHPDRINHWQQVDPLESLAGSHPVDDIIVMLCDPVQVQGDTLYIDTTPIQITGRFYALVQFVLPISGTDQFQVIHFDRTSRQFTGDSEVMRLPEVVFAKNYGSYPSTTRDIEHSPYNETGWYVYGAKDANGVFVVQSIAPRALFQLQPEKVTFGRRSAFNYVRFGAWKNAAEQKGKLSSVLCSSRRSSDGIETAIEDWKIGDKALLLHTYGGIGGNNKEPAAATPIFFGHFAYGIAEVVYEPLADEPRFDIQYHQVYTQNTDGLVAGTLHWSRYMGDRQFGWLGTRPVCDILIKLDAFTEPYQIGDVALSPLDLMRLQLEVMTARYRIGDGTGGTFVGPANNCSQDSNQALFASIQSVERILQNIPDVAALLLQQEESRYRTLRVLGEDLESALQPFGGPRSDWQNNEYNLGSTLEDDPLRNLWIGLGSWRTMFPRKASDTIAETFIQYGASVWVLRTNQMGGFDPDISPIAPTTF
ncbi:CAAX protease, partial [Pseudanabaenaceae cyanobacterium LEGE 13415]|nr:CAAX protease [Pseudanabaenaceae cyanobacterium LEGE 13415]